jgi:hypothetical protein
VSQSTPRHIWGSRDITPQHVIKTLCREVAAAAPTPRAAPQEHGRSWAAPVNHLPSHCQNQLVAHPNQRRCSSQLYQSRSFQEAANSDVKALALMPILRSGPGVYYAARLYLPVRSPRTMLTCLPDNRHRCPGSLGR